MDQTVRKAEPESLQTRPDARAIKVEDVLADVQKGRIRIPVFQRGFKWERDDAIDLMDSLFRGYPVGTLLFWETAAEAGEVRFGTVTASGDARADALWVVDGQQRIVSLVRALLANSADEDGFAIYFDLDTVKFVKPPSASQFQFDPSRWLPLTEVLDSEQLMQWVFKFAKDGQHAVRRERAFQVGKRLREYEIPAYFVKSDNQATLREIFNRSNSKGKRLEVQEVFDALHGATSSQRPGSIKQISEALADLEFGALEEKIIYRLLRVLQDKDVTARSAHRQLRLTDAAAQDAYQQTAAAARRVVQFVKSNVCIGHYELLPYKMPLVTLGKFFHHHPSPSPRSRELLARWFWRGALNGSHRGDTVSTRSALNVIDPLDEDGSVQMMLLMVKKEPDITPGVHLPFNFGHAASKLLALAMMDLQPRNLLDGSRVSVEHLLNSAASATLPFPQISSSGSVSGALLGSAANRLVHPGLPALRTQIDSTLDATILMSHGINVAAIAALRDGKMADFLTIRAHSLKAHADVFFGRRARWNESDRPPLAALLVPDEAD